MPVLRPASGALQTALANGTPTNKADLFTIGLQSGGILRYCSWDSDLVVGGSTYVSAQPWLERSRWGVENSMVVGNLEVFIKTNSMASFGGGPQLRTQIHNGLLDGAVFELDRVFMPPGTKDTTTYGTVPIFVGDVGAVEIMGALVTLKIRGKSARLAQAAPRNVYQPGCLHTFCDPGCTLNAATFTTSETVTSATRTAVTLGALPGTGQIKGGTLTMTSGVATGEARSIIAVSGTTLTVAYPLTAAPSNGDTCTVFTGCDKTLATCNVTYSNKANFRGFPYIPPPGSTVPVQ